MTRRTFGAAGKGQPANDKAWYRKCKPRYLFVVDFEATCFEEDQLPPRASSVREADAEIAAAVGPEAAATDNAIAKPPVKPEVQRTPESDSNARSPGTTNDAAKPSTTALSAEDAARVEMFRSFQILPGHRLQEVIEFPIVLVDVQSGAILESWQRYVRPTLHPTLSDFCTRLTGIDQATVDAADTFDIVLRDAVAWMRSCGAKYDLNPIMPEYNLAAELLSPVIDPTSAQDGAADDIGTLAVRLQSAKLVGRPPLQSRARVGEPDKNRLQPSMVRMDRERNWAMATDTRRDLSFFLAHQLRALDLACPDALQGAYVDTRSTFAQHTDAGRQPLEDQLRVLRLSFEGRQHSGLDDATNIARVAIELARRGCIVRTNSFYLHDPRPQPRPAHETVREK